MPNNTPHGYHDPSHLSTVLGVAPHRDPNCLGIAIQKNRRCRLPASSISGRAQASSIMDHGTRLLDSGDKKMGDILNALAPLLLCHSHHQYQAGQLVAEWSRKVEEFHEQRRASVGLFSMPHVPAPDGDSERARRYGCPTPHADRGPPQQRSSRGGDANETMSRVRDDHSGSIRISSAPLPFDDAEEIHTPTHPRSATVSKRYQARGHRSRTTVDPGTLWSGLEVQSLALYAQLPQELSRFDQKDSGPSTYMSSLAGSSRFSQGASRPWSHHTPSPTTSTILRMTHGESTSQQTSPISRTRSPTRSEAEMRISESRGRAMSEGNPTPKPCPRWRVAQRDVEGVCNICWLPFLTGEADAKERHEENDDRSSASDEEACEDKNALHGGVAELVWCGKQCGNNFHRACMDSWIATFEGQSSQNQRQPTCPMCRAEWVEGP